MQQFLLACFQLMRIDRPVGTVLLAAPMLWSLWLASAGAPPANIVFIFLLGAFLMRSAGCVINDFADRHVDHQVKRTKDRPLTSGRISTQGALFLFLGLILCALMLLLFLPQSAVWPAILSFVLATLYPFTKRFFIIPQLVLGLAYSSSVIMAYVTIQGEMPAKAWLVFVASTVWVIVYDTFYAMVDRDDDIALGIHSSALWFGSRDLMINTVLMLVFLLLMCVLGVFYHLSIYYYAALMLSAGCFLFQWLTTRQRQREACFVAFLNNQWVGILIFLGILLSYLS